MAPQSFVSAAARSTVILLLTSLVVAQNCVLTVPPNPLTAAGLATPYQLSGCDQRQFSDEGCFVEAAIFDPTTNSISIYHPLVVNQGDVVGKDFIAPVPVTVPSGATVGIWFGSNAVTLTLAGSTNGCVNGLGNSLFGQFATCNGDQFMQTALAAVASGALTVPALGTGKAGTCPTTRDFRIVDMDQSDNVVTEYLLINNHVLSQSTPAVAKNNTNAVVLSNGSDNALLDVFVDPVIGCTPYKAQSPTAASGSSSALALNELMGSQFQTNPALIPANDDMVVINNNGSIQQSLQKVNLYRAAVGQPLAQSAADASGTTYCKNIAEGGIWIAQNQGLFETGTSPDAAMANDLYTFLAQRFAASFGPVPALGCQTIFGLQNNPVSLSMDGNDVVTAATINTVILSSILNGQLQPGTTMVVSSTVSSAVASTTATATGTATSTGKAAKAGTATNTGTATSTGASIPVLGTSSLAKGVANTLTSTAATTTLAAPTTINSAHATATGLWRHRWGRSKGRNNVLDIMALLSFFGL